MALVPHKVVALNDLNEGEKNTIAGAVVSLFDTEGNAVTLFDDESGANGSTAKQTDSEGVVVVYVTPGEYDEQVNGGIQRRVLVGNKEITTEQLIERIRKSREGDVITTTGFYAAGDAGGAQWKATNTTGLTPSQTPADRGAAELVDGSGRLWFFVPLIATSKKEIDVLALGAVLDGATDDFDKINAAINSMDGGVINIGGYLATSQPIVLADKQIILKGTGMNNSGIKAISAISSVLEIVTNTNLTGDRVPCGGVIELEIDGNDLANNGLYTESVNYGRFDQIRVKGAIENQILATTGQGKPSSQHNRFGTIEVFASGDSNGFVCDGAQGVGNFGNFSLNYIENIFVLLVSSTGTGDAFVFGFTDGNYVSHLRVFRSSGHTGAGVRFKGDDEGTVTGGAHARLNVISHLQAGPGGVVAESGSAFSSSNTILKYSSGNGSPDPVVESGASLGWDKSVSGMRGTFSPTIYGTSAAGSPTYSVQKGRYVINKGRLFFDLEVEISTIGGMSGNIGIGNLPQAMINTTGTDVTASISVGQHNFNLGTGKTQLAGQVIQGQNAMLLFASGSGVSPSTITGGLLSGNEKIRMSGSYPVF